MTSLNWRDNAHWSDTQAPCVHCGMQTNLRDDERRPSHKSCAETALRTPTPVNALTTAALACAKRGWHVFPLVPGRKVPAVREWQRRATTDPDRIARCWEHDAYNIGLATGPSGLVVVDLDTTKDGDEPSEAWSGRNVTCGADVLAAIADEHNAPYPQGTFTVVTPSGGRHLYFVAPDGPDLRNTCGTIGWKVDTRAHGGYVVAAGSTVDGKPYTVADNSDPAVLPAWLATLLRPAPLPAQEPTAIPLPRNRRGAYLQVAVDAELERVTSSPDDGHNNALYVAAVALGQLVAGGALAEGDVTARLAHAAAQVGQPEREALRTIQSGLRAGARRPRRVAA